MSFQQPLLLDELKANPRLRWGLLGILGVLWLYGVLELRDQVQIKADSHLALSKKIARIQGVASQTDWPARLTDARALQTLLEKNLWRENSIGLAQATFNDWLAQLAQQASLSKVQLSVAAQNEESAAGKDTTSGDSSGAGRLWKVSAKFAFDFNPQTFYPLLVKITSNDKQVLVESLVIHGLPSPKAELLLVAYFLKQKPTATPASAKQNEAK